MLTIIFALLAGLIVGHFIRRLMDTYKIVRREQELTADQMVIVMARLGGITGQLNSIWATLQANGYQTDAYTGYSNAYTGATFVQDWSGYNFTGYGITGAQEDAGIPVPIGPTGAIGPQGERIVLGAAVPSTIPPVDLLPEVDYLEEPRLT